jgi:hypothetical protein
LVGCISKIEADIEADLKMKKPPPKPTKIPGHLPPPPPELKKAGRDLWVTIVREFELDDAGSQAVLAKACMAADMAAACRERIAKDGLTIPTKNGVRDHPLIRAVLMAQSFMTRSLIRLGAVDPPKNPMGRPPGRGNLGVDRAAAISTNGEDA